MTTAGQTLTATLRKSNRVGPRTRDRRDGLSIKADMLESIEHAIYLPGYYGEEATAIRRAATGALLSYRKHIDGYRVDGTLIYRIASMSPWAFAGLLGSMVDAGVTNVGEGEAFFASMSRQQVAA